jgi:hypothetical protein
MLPLVMTGVMANHTRLLIGDRWWRSYMHLEHRVYASRGCKEGRCQWVTGGFDYKVSYSGGWSRMRGRA